MIRLTENHEARVSLMMKRIFNMLARQSFLSCMGTTSHLRASRENLNTRSNLLISLKNIGVCVKKKAVMFVLSSLALLLMNKQAVQIFPMAPNSTRTLPSIPKRLGKLLWKHKLLLWTSIAQLLSDLQKARSN